MNLVSRSTSWEAEQATQKEDEARLSRHLETYYPHIKSVIIEQEKYFDGDDNSYFEYRWVYGHEGKANQLLGEELDPLRWE